MQFEFLHILTVFHHKGRIIKSDLEYWIMLHVHVPLALGGLPLHLLYIVEVRGKHILYVHESQIASLNCYKY